MDITDLDHFDPPTDWVNYGDVNPEPHGGLFVRWDGSAFELVETTKLSAVDPEEPEESDAQIVTLGECRPDDIFVDGDPSKGLTDWMKGELEALDRQNYDPDQHPDHGTVESYAPEFIENLAYYAANHVRHYGGDSRMEHGDYESILSKFGIDDWE